MMGCSSSDHDDRNRNGDEEEADMSANQVDPGHDPGPGPGPVVDGSGSTTIRILTLNVWGLKYISQHRRARIEAIAHLIATAAMPAHIVCLQECWSYGDYVTVRRITRHVLPHARFFHSGVFGGGLVVLSRWRIVEGGMAAYALNGRPSAFWRGDWFVGKGVGWARVRLPDSMGGEVGADGGQQQGTGYRTLDVFNTHLHAPYDEGREGKDTYSCHRVAQAWEIAGRMRRAMETGNLVVGCGDFNMIVAGLEWRVIQAQTRGLLRDVWRDRYPASSVGAWVDDCEQARLKARRDGEQEHMPRPPTVEQSLALHGHTCDSVLNTWRWSKARQKELFNHQGNDGVAGAGEEDDPRARRLDYIFLGDGTGDWVVKDVRVCMTERHPQLRCSLSDHFAVQAEIVRRPSPSGQMNNIQQHHHQNGAVINPIHHHHNRRPRLRQAEERKSGEHRHQHNHALYTSILDLISTYTRRSRLHRRRRLTHFLLSVLFTLASFVAIWFSTRNYVSFILVVVSSLSLMAGTVDGLIGGLFGGSELRALKDWEWEVRNALRLEKEGKKVVGQMDGVFVQGEGLSDGLGEEWEKREEEEEEDEKDEEENSRVRDWWD